MIRTAIIIIFLAVYVNGYSQPSVTADAQTLSFLQQFRDVYATALKAGQAERMTSFFADSIRLMPEYQRTVWTKGNAGVYYRAFLKRFNVVEYNREIIEVMDLGKMLIELGTLSEVLQQKENGKTDTIRGKYADIWKKDDKGRLELVTQAWNYSHQVAIADRMIFPDVPAVTMAYQGHIAVNNPLSFEIAAYNGLQEKVVTEHNAKLWGMFYSDDYILFYSAHPVYKGRKELDAYLEDHVKHLPVFEKLDIRTDRIEDLEGYVIEYASHIAIVRNGDWSGVGTGKNIRVWRREKNGILRICRGVAMYD
jgi:ketosteroid isomerase-like protein